MARTEYIFTTRDGCTVAKIIPEPGDLGYTLFKLPRAEARPCQAHPRITEWRDIWHRWEREQGR